MTWKFLFLLTICVAGYLSFPNFWVDKAVIWEICKTPPKAGPRCRQPRSGLSKQGNAADSPENSLVNSKIWETQGVSNSLTFFISLLVRRMGHFHYSDICDSHSTWVSQIFGLTRLLSGKYARRRRRRDPDAGNPGAGCQSRATQQIPQRIALSNQKFGKLKHSSTRAAWFSGDFWAHNLNATMGIANVGIMKMADVWRTLWSWRSIECWQHFSARDVLTITVATSK